MPKSDTRESTLKTCSYCGLVFSGAGCSPTGDRCYCCYGCYLVEKILRTEGEEGIATGLVLRLGIGMFLAMNVMMMSVILYIHSPQELGLSTARALQWAMLLFSTPAVLILGGPFVLGAARDLRAGRLSTDALIATGSYTAYFVSTVNTIRASGHVYFDTATMLLLIVTLGRLMEASAKMKTSGAIRELMELEPGTARVLRDGTEVEVHPDDLRAGETVVVRPGERIPADGRITSGNCLVEEAVFTGEARPRSCSEGDEVFGGSINCDGLLQIELTAVGAETTLAQIRQMVHQAQIGRAPVERLTERVSSVFVPAVWLLAAAAGIYWGIARSDVERAALSALAVLVVACPCALGLATPMATCLAIGRAARSGVLIRSGEVLERLVSVGRVFFDKTGTLTTGRLAVHEVIAAYGVSEEEALAWAAAVESGSEHAIARAIMAAADERGIPRGRLLEFTAIPGAGVEGLVEVNGMSRRVLAGSPALVSQRLEVPAGLTLSTDSTTTCVGWDGQVRAAILFSDDVRPEARQAVDRLREMNIKSAVVSGDLRAPVQRLANELGMTDVFAECSPAEKADIVSKAASVTGQMVAMVGDGINDAPALACADIGMATGGGTDLARQTSDVTLLGDNLTRIPEVIELSRRAYRIIRQNLAWAFGYNCIAIALAAAGILHPLFAALAMFISSITVIANSMRLMR